MGTGAVRGVEVEESGPDPESDPPDPEGGGGEGSSPWSGAGSGQISSAQVATVVGVSGPGSGAYSHGSSAGLQHFSPSTMHSCGNSAGHPEHFSCQHCPSSQLWPLASHVSAVSNSHGSGYCAVVGSQPPTGQGSYVYSCTWQSHSLPSPMPSGHGCSTHELLAH